MLFNCYTLFIGCSFHHIHYCINCDSFSIAMYRLLRLFALVLDIMIYMVGASPNSLSF